ncbi:S1 RNA-binding domain-containing protein [Candidatus Peregrinibacteria bacterium]|nr:S1 RNA-binding domain-containing protein [Candidatus Peregrinibacteria bacterium]
MAKRKKLSTPDVVADSFMEELFQGLPPFTSAKAGEMISGTIIDIQKDKILLDLFGIYTGIISGRELRDRANTAKQLKVGDILKAYVIEEENPDGLVVLSLRKASEERTWEEFQEAFEKGTVISVRPHEANKGGLLLEIDNIKGFIPVSQLAPLHYPRVNGADALRILERLQKLIGVTFKVKIINLDKENGKLILSEKSALEEERKAVLQKLKIGQKVKGRISGIVKFGIFVAFEGLEGLVHISEIAWGHVSDPSEHGRLGDPVEVLVIGIDNDKISLSMKRLTPDPWIEAAKKFKVGQIIESEIARTTEFGAFIKLDTEINGLIHLSEVTDDPTIKDIRQILKIGDKVKAKIIAVEPEEHRIGLSIKALSETAPAKKTKAKKEKGAELSEGKVGVVEARETKVEATESQDGQTNLSDVKGVSAKVAAALEKGGYKTLDDLKKAKKEDLVALEGIGEKTAEKLLAL